MKPLPSDYYLAELISKDIGKRVTAEEIQEFHQYINRKSKIEPGTITCGLETLIFIGVNLIIGIGFRILAGQQKQEAAPTFNPKQQQGESITTSRRFVPRFSFDSIQEPAKLGDVIPLVFAERLDLPEQFNPYRPAGRYGAVRVNLPLLWSQVLSLGGSNFIRTMLMIGEGRIGGIDLSGFAIGNTSLTSYDLLTESANEESSRVTIYFSPNGGRIKSEHRILGRSAANDPGNAENQGGQDVLAIRGEDNNWRQHFCFASTPTANNVFGLYGHIPNRFTYRVNPVIRPTIGCQVVTGGSGTRFECDDDAQSLASYWKSRYHWSVRSGIISSSVSGATPGRWSVSPGDTILYRLSSSSDALTGIDFNSSNTDNPSGEIDGKETCKDVASAVASWQNTAADNLIIGEKYRIGSCLAVLTSSNPSEGFFRSESESEPPRDGNTVDYVFTVVAPGQFDLNPDCVEGQEFSGRTRHFPPQWNVDEEDIDDLPSGRTWSNCTNFSQIFRVAEAVATIERDAFMFEIGISSTLGITSSGLCNFRSTLSIDEANDKAGLRKKGKLKKGSKLRGKIFQSGVNNVSVERYAFFKILIRNGNTCFEEFPHTFGMSGRTSQEKNDFLKFQVPEVGQWEVKLSPISGWEIADGQFPGDLIVLDSSSSSTYDLRTGNGVKIFFVGRKLDYAPNQNFFRLNALEPPKDLGLKWTDERVPSLPSMLDAEGAIAERFPYTEVTTSMEQGPEFRIRYINTITVNQTLATYDGISGIVLNLAASAEFSTLTQVSAKVNAGQVMKKLRNADAWESSSLFPDLLRYLQTSEKSGVGEAISDMMIDLDSYRESAEWCFNRRYFYNGPVIEPVNANAWGEEVSRTMLLDFFKRNGKYTLKPKFSFDEPVEIVGQFGKGQIREDSFAIEIVDQDQRRPVQVSVIWRQERNERCPDALGFFPVNRQVLVRRACDPDTVELETYDLSAYCDNEYHAIDFACSVINERILITKKGTCKIGTQGLLGSIGVFDCIKIAEKYSSFRGIASGRVTQQGVLITSNPEDMGPGEHDCITWAADGNDPIEQVVTVDETGKLASPAGIVFSKNVTVESTPCYKIVDLDIDEEGDIAASIVEWPIDPETGFSLMVKNWTTYETDENWSIIR